MPSRDVPIELLRGSSYSSIDVTNAGAAQGAGEAGLEEVADERVGSGHVACARATPAKEAVALAFLDHRACLFFADAGGDRPELEVHGFEQRGAHEELLELRRQVPDDLLGEVFVEVPLCAAQRRDECPHLGGVPIVQGSADELQRGGPALGAPAELRQDGWLEPHLVRLAEEALCLCDVEAQIVRPELGDLTQRPKPGEPDRGFSTAGKDERHSLGPALQQLPEHLLDVRRVVDEVNVVEDERGRVVRQPAELTQEGVEHGLE